MDQSSGASPYAPVDEEIIGQWLDSLNVSAKTKQAYAAEFKAFCKFVRDTALDFDELTKRDIISYKEYLLLDRKMAPTSVSTYLAAVKSFYNYSEDNGLKNIAHNVKGERVSRDFKKDILTPSQAREMLAAIDRESESGMRDYAMLNLMLRTGLRDIEVSRANIGDLTTESGADVLYVHGKGRSSKDAFVVLTESALRPIREYLALRPEASASDPLFASVANRNAGRPLSTRSISRIAKNAMRAIGIDDSRHTAHSLRHSAITFSLMGGSSERDAQQMARHASITTTMIYSHNIKRIENAAENKIDNILGGAE